MKQRVPVSWNGYEIVYEAFEWAIYFRGARLSARMLKKEALRVAQVHYRERQLRSFQNLTMENGGWLFAGQWQNRD